MDPSSFSAFTVIQQTLLSGHNQTNIYIKRHNTPEQKKLETCKLYQVQQRYKWTSDRADKFIQALNSAELKNLFTIFMNKTFETTKDGVNLVNFKSITYFKKQHIQVN